MSQTNKVDRIEIRNRPGAEGKLSTGSNTQVLLNGELIKGCSFIKFEVKPSGITKVLIEMYAELSVDANIEFSDPKYFKTDLRHAGSQKDLTLRQISSFDPISTVIKK